MSYQERKVYLKNIKMMDIDQAEECLNYLLRHSDKKGAQKETEKFVIPKIKTAFEIHF
jgi:pyrroloquinoline quinone (PQQ) biosynthesis protein C